MLRWLSYGPKVAYLLRGGVFRLLVLIAGGSCGPGMRIERGFRLRQGLHSGLHFGRDVYFGRDCTLDVRPPGSFMVGSNVTFTQGVFVSVCQSVAIGNDVLIGEYSSIRDANHQMSDLVTPIADQPMIAEPITIGANVWLGRGCAILAGVVVGEGAVVGSNAVVTKSVSPDMIVGGVPAKVLRSRAH